MPFCLPCARLLFAFCLFFCLGSLSSATDWILSTGERLQGDPIETYGPFAIFRKPDSSIQKLRFRSLSTEDCRRFFRECQFKLPRSEDWSKASGKLSRELLGRLRVLQNRKLAVFDTSGRPEPELFVLLFASHNDGPSWRMLDNIQPTYNRIRRVYSGRVEAVFYGIRHDAEQHVAIISKSYRPFLTCDYRDQAELKRITELRPKEGILMLAVTRNGTPLLSSPSDSLLSIRKFVDDLAELLRQGDPDTPSTWKDRLHYANAVRPLQFAESDGPPLLVANPFRLEALHQYGIGRIDARLDIDAGGKVTQAEILPSTQGPAARFEQWARGLRQAALFSPAIDMGKAVPASYHFSLIVPASDILFSADRFWLKNTNYTEVPLNSWFVLRPIMVPEQLFSTVAKVDENGVNMMTSFEASSGKVSRTSQMNSFNTDFFSKTGAAELAPSEGEQQLVDGQTLVWERVEAVQGYVDLQTEDRKDYCIGYAWTELETPQALEAWLGIGSDDGLKIWLNGELVHDKWIRRMSQLDDDIVPLKLREGKNRLLIKIQNATGDWSFTYRMRVKEL